MNSETDYSIRLPGGTREITGSRAVPNRAEERRRKKNGKRRRGARPDDAVEAELTDQDVPPEALPADEDDADDAHEVDCLA
jgi:hypothetical protein